MTRSGVYVKMYFVFGIAFVGVRVKIGMEKSNQALPWYIDDPGIDIQQLTKHLVNNGIAECIALF